MLALRAVAVGMGFLLSACGAEDELAKCLNSNEQTILLKQMALTDKAKKNFDDCNQLWQSQELCRAVHLNANGLIRTCMKGAGYTFINNYISDGFASRKPETGALCYWGTYTDAKCYRLTWLATIEMWLGLGPPI
jgi:hypothetical protein